MSTKALHSGKRTKDSRRIVAMRQVQARGQHALREINRINAWLAGGTLPPVRKYASMIMRTPFKLAPHVYKEDAIVRLKRAEDDYRKAVQEEQIIARRLNGG